MTGAAWEYAAVFFVSLVIALVLTPLMLRVATDRGILDRADDRAGRGSPVPYLGGLAIVVALSIAILTADLLRPPEAGAIELAEVMAMAIVLSLVGLLDDLRGLGVLPRLLVEVGTGIGIWAVGAGVEIAHNEPVDILLTVLWVVGITNAFNLLDNMDGLSAGVAMIGALSFFVIAVVNGQFLVAGLSAALAGCALGFLRHNIHPARIYMGDAGSLYLGFLLAYLGLKLRFDAPDDITFLVPILVLGIPILDTALVTIERLRHGRSPLRGGRDHISHRLVNLGMSVRGAVGVIYAGAAGLGVIALVVSRADRTSAYILAGVVFVVGLLAIGALGRVPVDDDIAPDGAAAARAERKPSAPDPST